MIIVKKPTLVYLLLAFLFGMGFSLPFFIKEPRIKLGEHYIYCNPKAKVNLKKTYHLHLWDYDWPIKENGLQYRDYLLQAVRDFQKVYPNVRVEIKLLDLITGPAQLEQSIKINNAPDIYCSAYMIPKFNFKRQIPIGPYLKESEQEVYFQGVKKMLTFQGTLCYFPRWIAPDFWVGNQTLMESAGLSVSKIQNTGWCWQDIRGLQKGIPKDKYLLVGNLGANGFLKQLIDCARQEFQTVDDMTNQELYATIDLLETLIHQKAIPVDCDRNMLGRFLGGQAMFLAGLRPTMYNFIIKKHRNNPVGWQPVLLPVPVRFTDKEKISVENGVIAIYRNKRTAGDDHLTVAMKFGQFLSYYQETTPWESLLVVPAAKNVYNKWIHNIPQNEVFYNRLNECSITNKIPLSHSYQEKTYPILNDFISKKITGIEVKAKLSNE